jgi:hypothetical protein
MHWLFAHFIGDYLFQTDYMAIGKKKSWLIAGLHVLTYMIPFLFIGSFITAHEVKIMIGQVVWWKLALIAIQHLLQDRSSFIVKMMQWKGSASFVQPPMGPWSVVLTDNLVHIMFIAFVLGL